jgi:hypothetical protein
VKQLAEVTGPIDGDRPPYGAPPADALAERGYVVEEFQLAGLATAYAIAGASTPTSDGRWEIEPFAEGDFRTRLLVVRPDDPARFNGTVVLNWQNVSAGFEGGAPSGGELYDGYAWVGASVQEVGLYGAPMGMTRGPNLPGRALVDHDPERYGELFHPGEPACFDMFSQAARAVGVDRVGGPDPLGGLDVQRVVATGASQSAMKLVAYANGLHPRHRVIDGFLLSVWEGRAPRLDDGPMSFSYLRCKVRDDLDTPVIVVNSEFETPAVQPLGALDSETFRMWEVAGTPHGSMRRAGTPDSRGWTANTLSIGPVYEAALRAMHSWLADDVPAPSQPRIETQSGTPPSIRRDRFGNAIGGIRLPDMAAPVAEHRGMAFGSGRAPLLGASRPFDEAELRLLYPTRTAFVERWCEAVDDLVASGALRPGDAAAQKERVASIELPATIPL